MNRILYSILSLLLCLDTLCAQDVVINEIMQSNVDAMMVKSDFPDSWIELYNNRSAALALKGWRIGLTNDYEQAWMFRNSMTIFGHSYLLVYCDKMDNGYQHTDFHLDAKKCTIYLWDANGNLVDSLAHKKQPAPNIAYGRTHDGGDEWEFEVTPTPGSANGGVFTRLMLPDPVFSMPGQVLTNGAAAASDLIISFPDSTMLGKNQVLPDDARLYVTLDGSAPTLQSPSYAPGEECRIRLTGTTIVRARLLSSQALAALPVTHSYIVHPRPLNLPVFSFTTNAEYLYDDEIGMLLGTDYSGNCYKGWRRPFNLEYYEPAAFDSALINQVCEAGMHGAGSLSHKQKAMNVYTNKRWQNKRFDCHTFWPARPELHETKTFCVRNGGSRCLDSRFEDAFVQRLFASHVDSLQYLEYRPCIVYINGEYRGLYGLRERANHTWAENNRGVDEDVVQEIESFYDSGAAYAPVRQLIDRGTATYADFCQYIDMPLLLDYLCCQAFATNTLFPHSNVFMWQDPTGDDRRIHPLLKDLDALAETANSTNWYNFITLTGSEGQWAGSYEQRRIFAQLFELAEFRNAFIDRMQAYLGDFCKPSVTLAMVSQMRDEIDSEVAATFAAIDEGAVYSDFTQRIDQLLIPYCQQRPMIHYQHLADRFALGRVIPMQVQNHAPGAASSVRINGIALTEGDYDGACFSQREVRLETGNLDYCWSRTILYLDGHTDYRVFNQQSLTFCPDPSQAQQIASVSFNLYYRPLDSHDVQLCFTDGGVICTNPYAGNGVEVVTEGMDVSIVSHVHDQVTYRLEGKADEAQLTITSDAPWTLVLDGVRLTRSHGSILRSTNATPGTILLADGSENLLENVALEADRQAPGAAIDAQGALTLSGSGVLTINTSGKVGRSIATPRQLTIDGGTYHISNRSKGLKDYGVIWWGTSLYSGGDICLRNGDIHIVSKGSAGQGIQAQGAIIIGDPDHEDDGPLLDVDIQGTTMYTPSDQGTITMGCMAIVAQGDVSVYGQSCITARATDNASNGIKSYTSINIYGGQHHFACYDDCLNSPGPIAFWGGTTVCFSTDDDAIDSDYPYPGAIRLAGGNLLTYTLDVATEEGLDCDDDNRIFISGGIVVSAGGAQHPDSRQVGGATQSYYLGPYIADSDARYYYSVCDAEGSVICTYRFQQSFANRLSLITAPQLGRGGFNVVYGTEPPYDYTQAVGDSFWIGGKTTNRQSYTFDVNNPHATTMAVMGASISVMPESHVCKDEWAQALDLDIRDYGIRGAGLCLYTLPGYGLQEQADDVAFAGRPDYDAYLIWAPSNDFQKGGTIGQVTDYTAADGFSQSKRATMCGGLNYCLHSIRQKDPDACVLLLTTMPIFNKGSEGYDPNATGQQAMRRYVDAQILWCQHNDVPYLDLFRQSGLTQSNHKKYMLDDEIHLSEAGYELIQGITTDFLRQNIRPHSAIAAPADEASHVIVDVHSLTGQRIAVPQQGFSIVRYSDGRVEKRLVR